MSEVRRRPPSEAQPSCPPLKTAGRAAGHSTPAAEQHFSRRQRKGGYAARRAPAVFGGAAGKAVAISTDLATGKARLGTQAGQFVNLYEPARKLLIVGAVQIGQALAAIAQTLGMAVTVNDPRERFLSAERFPGVTLTDAWPDEAVASFAPNAACAVVTLSHDIKIDDPALIAALAQSTGYIGALGSRANHARRLERLAAAGVSADDLRRVDGPAGLPIGGLGPQEIALSIAAGMVAAFRGTR